MKIILPGVLAAYMMASCITEFDPPSQGYENLLVVEAFLTNDGNPFEVKLSRSVPIDTTALIPERWSSVLLSDGDGEVIQLFESSPGIYTSIEPVHPMIGGTYTLRITTADGKRYASTPVVMRQTPDIDSVSYEFERRDFAGVNGVQIYVSTRGKDNNTWYYRWEWDETWIFMTPYYSTIVWDDATSSIRQRMDNINSCWKYGRSTSVLIYSSRSLLADVVNKYPLHFVDNRSDRLRQRYSINVKQYALSEEAFVFWRELQKVTETLGTLFDPQPSIVRGNIWNTQDDREVVLGYFDASSVSEKRIFIGRSDLPQTSLPNYYINCTDTLVSYGQVQEMMRFGYMLSHEVINLFGGTDYLMSTPNCIDCRLAGSNIPPDYWY